MDELMVSLIWHLFESTVLALALIGLAHLVRIRNSSARCWIYRLCFLKFLIPTASIFSSFDVSALMLGGNGFNVVIGPLQDARMLSVVSSSVEAAQEISQATSSSWIGEAIVWTWGIGIALLIIRWTFRSLRYKMEVKRGIEPFGEREQGQLDQLPGKLEGYFMNNGPGVGLYGIFRPRIVAQRMFLDSLSDEELTSALKHEVAHQLRMDNLWCLIAEVVVSLFWFNPLVWVMRRRLQFEMEKACDEYVLFDCKCSSGYANCLLKAAEFSNGGSYMGAVCLSETSLKRRVRNVIEYKHEKLSKMKMLLMGVSAPILFAGSFAIASIDELKDVDNNEERINEDFDSENRINRSDIDAYMDQIKESDELPSHQDKELVDKLRELELKMAQMIEEHAREKAELVEKTEQMKRKVEEMAEKKEIAEVLERVEKDMLEVKKLAEKKALAANQDINIDLNDVVNLQPDGDGSVVFAFKKGEKVHRLKVDNARVFGTRLHVLTEDDDQGEDNAGGADIRRTMNDEVMKEEIYNLQVLDKLPRAVFQKDPKYPYSLKMRRAKGWVDVEWVITSEGEVANVVVVASTHKAFEDPAIDSIRKSRWRPGELNGEPVGVRVRQRFTFNPH